MLSKVEGVQVAELHSTISRATGLELRMPRIFNARTGERMV